MNWKQKALARIMREISEECYSAGWMHGLEYKLWDILSGKTGKKYGQSEVTDEQIAEMREISDEIAGWIYWADDEAHPGMPPELWGPRFIPMDDWLFVEARSNA